METNKQSVTDPNVEANPAAPETTVESSAQAISNLHRKRPPSERIDVKQPGRLWIVVLFLGWTFDFLFWKHPIGVNFALFSALCLMGGTALLSMEGYRPARNSLWLLFPFAFFASVTFLRQEPLTIFLAYTFALFSLGLLVTSYRGGRWFQYGLADYLSKFVQLLAGVIYLPMEFIAQVWRDRAEGGEKKGNFPLWALLRGLLIALPIVVCFASLLASADLVFNQKLGDFFKLFSLGNLAEYFVRLVLILICAYVISGHLLHAASRSNDAELIGEDHPFIKPFLGFTESAVVLGSVSLLFFVFVVIQFQYFFGGETNIGVAGYTYSQYARRGFNELVIVAFFSLVMILGLSTVTRREHEVQKKIYSGLSVSVVTLVMVILVSAYQRISLAIDWHGFSRLRLYPRVFLVWLGVLLLVVVILEILRQERYFAFAAVLASLGFAMSLTLLNVDASIVKHNVPRVSEGKNLNVAHLSSLSTDAVPALVDQYFSMSLSPSAREGIGASLKCYLYSEQNVHTSSDWRSFNFSSWQAGKALDRVKGYLVGYKVNAQKWPVRVRTPSNLLYECIYYASTEED